MIANSNMFKLNPEYFEKTVIMQEENFPKQVDIFLEVYRAPPFSLPKRELTPIKPGLLPRQKIFTDYPG